MYTYIHCEHSNLLTSAMYNHIFSSEIMPEANYC